MTRSNRDPQKLTDKQLRSEAWYLAELEDISDDDDARLGALIDELDRRNGLPDEQSTETREQRLEELRTAPGRTTSPDPGPAFFGHTDPFERRAFDLDAKGRRDTAMRILEKASSRDHVTPAAADRVGELLDRSDDDVDGDQLAQLMLVTERPEYRTALGKWMANRDYELLDAERQALHDYKVFERAASLTNASGGFGVPALVDPTVVLTSGAADVPLLDVARIETITENTWRGVSSQAPTWSFDAEGAEVSDDSVTLAQPTVTAHTGRGFIPYSIEIEGDYPGFAMEMNRLLAQGYVDMVASATATGTGSAEPFGIFTAIAAHNSPVTEVTCATNGEINAVDIRNVWSELPERFRSRAAWFMNVSVESQIRAFASAANVPSDFTVDLTAEGVTLLNGRRVIRSDYAPDFSTTTTAQTNHLVMGDFGHYVIAQRADMRVERVQHLVGSNQRPTGQRGFFAWARIGADAIVDNAFRALINASV